MYFMALSHEPKSGEPWDGPSNPRPDVLTPGIRPVQLPVRNLFTTLSETRYNATQNYSEQDSIHR